jgi:hypothetical protein
MKNYQPKYKWRETWPGEGHQDFAAWDGETPVGRIRLEESGPMNGRWHWSGNGGPNVKRRLTPNTGYVATAREASRMVEDYYDRLMASNGLKPGI